MHKFSADIISDMMQQHHNELMRFVSQRVRCDEDAQDILQQTFIRYAEYSSKNCVDNPRAFIFRIAANMVVDHHRLIFNRQEYDTNEYTLHSIEDTGQNLEQQCDHLQRLEALNRAMQQLPEICRQAFYLNRIEGYTHAEIAGKLEISESMVGKHLVRAMKHCSDYLKHYAE
jgi:RNA polymerase sigma-70 factor (ECF subfamily)